MTDYSDVTVRLRPFIVMEMLRRADELARQGHNVISLGAGEPDFPIPSAVVSAVQRAMNTGAVGYTDSAGLTELRTSIAARYPQMSADDLDRVIVTPGSSGALDLVLRLLIRPGDEVMLKSPGYPCNPNLVHMANGVPRTVRVDASTNFHLTPELVRQNWSDRMRAVLVTSPCNPTGAIIHEDVLEQIVETVETLGGVVISDEIYHGLEYGQRCVSALEYSDQAFIINSFSKYFGMTGWRVGWLICPQQFVKGLNIMAQNQFISVNSLSQEAAIAALKSNVLPEYEDRRQRLGRRREFLYHALVDLGFSIPCEPRGAFYIYADAGKFSSDSYKFAMEILEHTHVVVTPGQDFGEAHGENFIRFSYTSGLADLNEAVRRLQTFLAEYKRGR